MKKIYHHRSGFLFVTLLAGLTTGCASMTVTNDALEKNTAFALGIEKNTFTIYDREDDGMKSTYLVKTNSGKKYSCYVTGSVTVVGRVVSDAICNEAGKRAKKTSETDSACNALLKAAGKCN